MCVCVYTCDILSTKIPVLLAKQGHFWASEFRLGLEISKDVKGYDMSLGLMSVQGDGEEVVMVMIRFRGYGMHHVRAHTCICPPASASFFSCDSNSLIISSPVRKGHRIVHRREPVSIRVCEGMKRWTNLQSGMSSKHWEDWEDWETTRHSAAAVLG